MRKGSTLWLLTFAALAAAPALLAACGDDDGEAAVPTSALATATTVNGAPPAMTLTSEALAAGAYIPKEYSCEGRNVSPPLRWSGAPPGTRSFAVIMDDPDAPGGTYVHWVLYDLPATTTQLAAAIPNNPSLDNGAKQGVNSARKTGYSGPCPPGGKDHHYSFRVYALDAPLNLEAGRNKGEVERAMQGHLLAQAELVGLYRR